MVDATPDKSCDPWLPSEENYLRAMYGWVPIRNIAAKLGRTESAVNVRCKKLQIPSLRRRTDVLTIGQFARAVGLQRQSARRLARRSRFSHTMYEYNRPVTVVLVDELIAWLKRPENWQHIDVGKIRDESLRRAVEEAKGESWYTIKEAARLAGYSRKWLYRLVRRKRLPATKGSRGCTGPERWLIRESHLQALIEANRLRGE